MAENKNQDWFTKLTAVIALIISGIALYHSTWHKEPDLRYSERWDISTVTVWKWSPWDIARGHPFGYLPGDRRIPVKSLVYAVELQNKGSGQTGRVEIKFSNLHKLDITTDRAVRSPRLEWEPGTHEKPIFDEKNKTLRVANLLANNDYIRLSLIIPFEKKTEITEKDIPYIEQVKFGESYGLRMGESFENGSIKRLQERLENQLSAMPE